MHLLGLAIVPLLVVLLLAQVVRSPRPRRRGWLVLGLIALVALALFAGGRAWWATRLDGMTLDEPYHIASGVSYVRTGDFRLNPEHPPLVKLWVGAALPRSSFHLQPSSRA
ncbi:MAG TPA: hypothetical protein VEW48_13935 [Thermoanaerobaculia bacterium]|nr:hypothetical protein [Thermoanaerobaculia bacterium]